MKPADVAALLKVLRRAKVAKFQMEGNSLAVEFEGAPEPEERESAIGFQIDQAEDDDEDEDNDLNFERVREK